jgi:hypothetical protein
MKFLVLWHFDVTRLTADVVRAITEQPKYGEKLDRLLAMSPVYNFATYQVLALAEMTDPYTVVGKGN